MSLLSDLGFRLRALVTRDRMHRDLGEEMAFHLEMETRQLVERGWTPAAAAAEARRRFGVVDREQQRARDSWGIGAALDAMADVRLALRQLWRRPAYTALGVGTLALGIGATVALSSIALGLLVRPLPVTDEARLQVFWSDFNWRGVEFDFVKERQRAFSGLAAYSNEGYTLRVNEQSSMVLATVGSAELFDVLGVTPLMGRAFRPGDDRPGAAPITVVSHGFWQQELGGDPDVIGRRIELEGAPVEIVGVMPRGFYFPSPMFRIWRPLLLDPATDHYQGNGWLVLVGRERDGLSRGERDSDVQAIAAALGQRFTYPEAWDKTRGAAVTPLRDYTRGALRPAVLLLQAAGAARAGDRRRQRRRVGARTHHRPRRGTGPAHGARRRPRSPGATDRGGVGGVVGARRRSGRGAGHGRVSARWSRGCRWPTASKTRSRSTGRSSP